MLNIEQAVQQKFPKFEHSKPWIKKSTLSFLRRLTHEQEVNRFLEQHSQLTGFDFIDEVLDYFNFSYSITNRHRNNIPATGRVVIVANHPLGALDGLSLLKMVGEVRRDVKIVANDMLLNFDALSPLFLPVDNLSKSTRKSSVTKIIDSLNRDEAVIVFPAGEVSRIRPSGVRDGKWNSGFLNFAKKTNAPILPVYVGARNSSLFYSASMVYKPLSGMMLAHEMFNQNSKTMRISVGAPIPYAQIEALPLVKAEKAKLIRRHLYRLAKGKKPLFATENTIAHPQDRRAIKQELKSALLLGETADQKKIYLFDYQPDSAVMQEIGRLREMTFRQVGEGTGKKRDLDQYDRDYRHLILWDEQELEIAGAYRIGEVGRIHDSGREIYSAELFDYQAKMQPYFAKGIELGRSFVSPKYWGKRSLDYLWYGIGAYLKQFPEVQYLFGPVSLSNSYPEFGKALIVEYYRRYFADADNLAIARTPYLMDAEMLDRVNATFEGSAETDFVLMREQLTHMQVTVPTLYKQYADVCEPGGVRFIDFNVDANFGHCIDGLVMVDLHKLRDNKRKRYLGE
ncbi:lysophospholipid acyltransferase family protein [Methylophaga sp. OBS3]|uniref:lysophospholipid acyltransferase family protein n=1 Tax=Methylophaga sp. OBS3 TaxID=2991934 RepID=UPI002257ACDA|nr:lysophospholipid acyltransferase family protein [Methylophaga sp. OBS3]MCX4189488.1 lysophospholipid acyltransferase family protein [Methylophaga sp. OBS3]